MSTDELPQVDPNEIVERLKKIRRNELPPDAVSPAELRAALAAQRTRFNTTGEAASEKKERKVAARKSSGRLDLSVLGDDMFE